METHLRHAKPVHSPPPTPTVQMPSPNIPHVTNPELYDVQWGSNDSRSLASRTPAETAVGIKPCSSVDRNQRLHLMPLIATVKPVLGTSNTFTSATRRVCDGHLARFGYHCSVEQGRFKSPHNLRRLALYVTPCVARRAVWNQGKPL